MLCYWKCLDIDISQQISLCHAGVSAYSYTTRATHNQRQKQQDNKKRSRCLQCTGGAGSLLIAVQAEWIIFNALVCEQDSMGGMSNEFGEIQCEGWVTYRITMLNSWDVYVVDHSSWRVVLVGLYSWDLNHHKSMTNLISRQFLDRQILDQQNCLLCVVSAWLVRYWIGISWTVISWEMQEEGER